MGFECHFLFRNRRQFSCPCRIMRTAASRINQHQPGIRMPSHASRQFLWCHGHFNGNFQDSSIDSKLFDSGHSIRIQCHHDSFHPHGSLRELTGEFSNGRGFPDSSRPHEHDDFLQTARCRQRTGHRNGLLHLLPQ